ncbi:origin recognition complex subunit 3 N-terminus-domain-containing protein, partial [Blyttiomyces helicus]
MLTAVSQQDEDEDPWFSITTGVFHVPSGKPVAAATRRGTSRSALQAESLPTGYDLLQSGKEPIEALRRREKLLKEKWETVHSRINDLLLELNAEAIMTIVGYVNSAYHLAPETALNLASPYLEIPTALVFAGINIPDHESLYTQMITSIVESGHAVARLDRRDCMTLSATVQHMIEQFMELERELTDDEDQEGEMVPKPVQ